MRSLQIINGSNNQKWLRIIGSFNRTANILRQRIVNNKVWEQSTLALRVFSKYVDSVAISLLVSLLIN